MIHDFSITVTGVLLRERLGFDAMGRDPDAMDHLLFSLGKVTISVPASGCTEAELVGIIYQAGAQAARREISNAREAFLAALK